MDIKRNLLIVALAVVSYLMLLAWNQDHPAQINTDSNISVLPPDPAALPTTQAATDLPEIQVSTTESASPAATPTANASTYIVVTTPSQVVTIDLLGGDIVRLTLPKFPVALDRQDEPFVLLDAKGSLKFMAQSGLIGADGPDASAGGRPLYSTTQSEYSMLDGELHVDLTLPTRNGVDIIKRYIFSADDYLIRVQYLIDNKGELPWRGNDFGQLKRSSAPDPSSASGGGFGINTYLGVVTRLQDDPYEKFDFGDMDKGIAPYNVTGGWIGFSQHYFLSSWIPSADSENTFTARRNAAGEYLFGFVGAESRVDPGQSGVFETGFWAGPKDQYRLEEISPDLGLTIDYGKLWFVAYPIFWVLSKINDQVGNFGLSIVLLTLVIRTLFYPLSVKQFRSQANMKRLQPKIQQLKEKHGEDKQKFMQAQMELWKKENVNPFSGCLPPLLQMPVFIGIFWVLNESVELRHASFILWYNDLSALDPYFVLPLLLGGAYYLQQHMTPMMTTDPTQEKVMKFMPVIFTVFFLWFPAGLVLYYLVNALVGILQQWYFIKKTERAHAKVSS
jgi:YidC/Oxa1 family membrane protein insertase